jgi:hypothetical protein
VMDGVGGGQQHSIMLVLLAGVACWLAAAGSSPFPATPASAGAFGAPAAAGGFNFGTPGSGGAKPSTGFNFGQAGGGLFGAPASTGMLGCAACVTLM